MLRGFVTFTKLLPVQVFIVESTTLSEAEK